MPKKQEIRRFCFGLIAICCCCLCTQTLHGQSSPPNIVYILADDLGYGELGCYGQNKIETPNIDALAAAGMLFTQHYAFPVCAPSRCMLLTGKHSGHAYIRGNHEWGERGDVWNFAAMEANPFLEGQWPIPDSVVTVAELLQQAGYATGIVGKWGLGAPLTEGLPNNQGFDYFYGFICQRQDHTYYPVHLWENENRVPLSNALIAPKTRLPSDKNPSDPKSYAGYQQADYAPDFLLQAAVRFMERNKDRPFFLFYTTPLPHVSLQAPQKWVDYYHRKFGAEKPFLGGSYFPCRYPRATYAAMVTTLDEQVGQLVKKLKEMGVYEHTLIVFTSDNGPTYNGGTDSPWFDSAGPFKSTKGWGKGYLHEGGIRVPLIVSWPGMISARSRSDLVSANWDAMPTLCQIAGIQPPEAIDGISYLPTLEGRNKVQRQHPYLYWEFPAYGGQQAVRLGRWKGLRMGINKGQMRLQLYDLEKDPQESKDVAAQHPDIVQKMQRIMRDSHQRPVVARFRMPELEQ